ncbi:hypothetical protein M8C21_022549, partial [Ambrosia artemisiifolia]
GMEYEYTSPKRRKISHTSDPFNDQFALQKQTNNNNIVIQGSTSGDNMIVGSFRKKLLVLDVNGLLVDIVADPDEAHKPDTVISSKAVFKRPFCDDFLKFCFQRFNVGVWTSRTRNNMDRLLQFLMRDWDTQRQFLFCWDQSHCTDTGFSTIENTSKPLFLKELKKLWEKQDPNLPWHRGAYDESNTLLLDNSPYKALRNPPHTAIFPYTYSYRNAHDNDLGPNGDLRNYLETLAASDSVQKFIEQNPFGQQPITHDNESWNFYQKIICSTQPGAGPSRSTKKLIVIDIGGLLADVIITRAETMLGSKAVVKKRPYCDEFLKFCFQTFNVGVWTSVSRSNTVHALNHLLRDTQHKLLFCWDLAHCTDTGFQTVENTEKTLLLKELRKLWEKEDPNLPWEIGEYDESNTLLVDTKSHRALVNPQDTAIFPYPYRHRLTKDDSLRELRVYLESLAATENVQKFVSENPFGQRPIREKNLSWGFYQKVIRAFSHKCKAGDSVDVQCKDSSEPKSDTAIPSVTKTLSEPKTNSATALAAAAYTLEEQETGTTTALVAPTILEPKPGSSTTPTLLEPKPNSAATSATHTLVEPETGAATAFVDQTLLEPDIDTTALAAQTSLEQEAVTTVLTAPTLLELEIGTTTALVGQTLSEAGIGIKAVAAQTSLESETMTTTMFTPPTLLKPEVGAANSTSKMVCLHFRTILKSIVIVFCKTLKSLAVAVMKDTLNPIYQRNPSLSRDLGGMKETDGRHYYLILENLEKDLCSLSMMNFIQEQTLITAQACVFPSLLSETYARGAILVDSKTDLQSLNEFIENPNHLIVSLSGRPWVIAEDRLTRTGIFNPTNLHSLRPKYENFGTKKDLKVVGLGTEAYTTAKRLKDLYVEFRKHCNGLMQRLAIEEKKQDIS